MEEQILSMVNGFGWIFGLDISEGNGGHRDNLDLENDNKRSSFCVSHYPCLSSVTGVFTLRYWKNCLKLTFTKIFKMLFKYKVTTFIFTPFQMISQDNGTFSYILNI